MKLGKVVKSDSHCDYVIQVDDAMEVLTPPRPDDYGFGCFVKLETEDRHWAVGLVYNSQLFNPAYLSSGPRLVSQPDPFFTPDLIRETRTLLWCVLIGVLVQDQSDAYGDQGIPSLVVPVNTPVWTMTTDDIHAFHLDRTHQPQFGYYSHLLRSGGAFASQLVEQVLGQISPLFDGSDRRALDILRKELSWKHTMGLMK
ncbi:hypothetical protein [Acaryochloris sp. CCMEE 5410]|uniref:hypothetical protein n=1 Tax=Acaryochloris sp. CCMEE 5410 TaxID=310037 RepID=UPI000248407A|nr:hypothetical protein [Acaryochloris sp. CCMEE 5410]KAI9135229.1 hypothetical protein ON05_019625 [Acaryochloris sp. CCMEE 5410]